MGNKGIGPQGLGIKGNNGYHIGSPAKKTTESKKDGGGADPYQANVDAFKSRMANKATGGINVDNTIESIVMGGPVVKGLTKAIGAGARAVGAARTAGAVGSKVGHGVAEAAHVGEVAHSAAHMKKSKNKK